MNSYTGTVASVSDALIKNQQIRGNIFLELGGWISIEVRSNSLQLISRLERYFQEHLTKGKKADIVIQALEMASPEIPVTYTIKEPDPGKTKIKEEYFDLPDGRIVRKRLTGMVFIFGGEIHLAAGPCLANDNQVVNFINNRFLEHMLLRKGLLAHAAGVCWDDQGMAIAGFSGTGKSTLSLKLLENGATFISNDRLVLRREVQGLRMYGIPKHPRVNPGTLLASPGLSGIIAEKDRLAFLELPDDELWHMERKYDVHVNEIFGAGRFKLDTALKGIAVLTWKRGQEKPHVAQVDFSTRRDLLDAFMKPVGLFFHTDSGVVPDFSPANYIKTMKECPVFEISGGVDFKFAADFIHDYLMGDKKHG